MEWSKDVPKGMFPSNKPVFLKWVINKNSIEAQGPLGIRQWTIN